jgi:hypothetical protein
MLTHTIHAATWIDHTDLRGYVRLTMDDGQFYTRDIRIPILVDHRNLENPVYVRSMILTGVTELATLALGRAPHHHGWGMPYRKDDLMVWEFHIDAAICEHGFSLNGRCPVEA